MRLRFSLSHTELRAASWAAFRAAPYRRDRNLRRGLNTLYVLGLLFAPTGTVWEVAGVLVVASVAFWLEFASGRRLLRPGSKPSRDAVAFDLSLDESGLRYTIAGDADFIPRSDLLFRRRFETILIYRLSTPGVIPIPEARLQSTDLTALRQLIH